jgi:tetratricopeptide (TPR) repeat protein
MSCSFERFHLKAGRRTPDQPMKFWAKLILSLCCCASTVAAQSTATVEAQLKRAVQTAPDSFAAHYRLSEFYLRQKQLDAAIPHLEKAQSLDAQQYACRYDLALAYVLTGKAAQARAQIAATLSLRETAELYALRGEVEEKAGDVHAAAAAYHRAAALEPNEKHLLSLANLLIKSSNYDEAKKFLDFGLRKYPRSAQLKVALGITEYSQGFYEKAVRTLCEAADQDPADARPYLFLGEMYGVAPTLADAITQRMAEFVKRHPQIAQAHYYFALSRWRGRRTGDEPIPLAGIEQSLTTAVRLDPKLAEAHVELGVLYYEQQRYQPAAQSLRKAVALQPDHNKAHYRLMQVYQRLGQKDLAEQEKRIHQRLKEAEARSTTTIK